MTIIGGARHYLIIFCYARDIDLKDFGDPETIREDQIEVFKHLVSPTVAQMSYDRTKFSFDATEWLKLPWLDEVVRDSEGNVKDQGYFNPSDRSAADLHQLCLHAFNEAIAADWNPDNYSGFVLCMATDRLRGWSNSYEAGLYWPYWIRKKKHFVTLSINSHWGRRIHELSHGLGVGDYYGGDEIITTGKFWDIGGKHNKVPLYSGYSLDRMGWYESENIKRLEWSEADYDETLQIQAHGFEENDQPDVYHLVRIKIFQGLIYYLEVRQGPESVPADLETEADALAILAPAVQAALNNPDQQLFDLHVPYVVPSTPPFPPAIKENGGLLITKLIDAQSQEHLNQQARMVTVYSNTDVKKLLEVGERTEDPARRLTITVEEVVQERPLRLKVRVVWKEVATADPEGLFNLRIRPWDENWQSPDIWVDSPANEYGTYDDQLDPVTGDIIGSGDRPWIDNENHFWVKFRNEGSAEAKDVVITWYLNSPPAIGDRGTWIPLDSKTIACVDAGETITESTEWWPEKDKHTCLKVAISTQTGESAVGDNSAQENIFDFDTKAKSPHQPIVQTVSIQNPLPEPLLVYVMGSGLPPGWEATVEHGWLWLEPLGEKQMRVAIFTDAGRERPLAFYPEDGKPPVHIPGDVSFSLQALAYRWWGEGPNVESHPELLKPIGGILINAHARTGASIDIGLDDKSAREGRLVVEGQIIPKTPAKVALSIRDARGETAYAWPVAGAAGSFRYEFETKLTKDRLPFRVNASIMAHDQLADTHSPTVVIESLDQWYYE